MAEFIASWKSTFGKYAAFAGRASRTEFWTWTLINLAISIGLGLVEGMLGMWPDLAYSVLANLFGLVVLVPTIAVIVRRLQDSGKSGWLALIVFVPILGWLALLILVCLPSQSGSNAHGPNPHGQ